MPSWRLRSVVGIVSAAVALAIGHLVAALFDPAASPVVVVGSQLVDVTPTPVKEVAVRSLGTADKPILIAAVTVVVLTVGALLGLIAWKRPRIASAGVATLGLIGAVVALLRPGFDGSAVVPSLAASIVGVATLMGLVWLYRGNATPSAGPGSTRGESDDESAPARQHARTTGDGISRRHLMIGTAAGAAVAALSIGGAVAIARVRRAGAAAARRLGLPSPASPATPIPDGAHVPGNTAFTTSIKDFYRVDIALTTPSYSTEGWSLTLDGDVENPMAISYDELMGMPMIERDITVTCVFPTRWAAPTSGLPGGLASRSRICCPSSESGPGWTSSSPTPWIRATPAPPRQRADCQRHRLHHRRRSPAQGLSAAGGDRHVIPTGPGKTGEDTDHSVSSPFPCPVASAHDAMLDAMVNLTRIYTRTGDAGRTRLSDNSETAKTDLRVEAYGSVDETNSTIAVAVALGGLPERVTEMLALIRNEMFDVGADLSTPLQESPEWPPLRIEQSSIDRLEAWCDELSDPLPNLRSFILPGGSPSGAQLHVARTVCRRAERAAWRCIEAHGLETSESRGTGGVNMLAVTYLNRLSDLLFIMSRATNGTEGDVLWVPGTDREKPVKGKK